jgi:hypothetical protein
MAQPPQSAHAGAQAESTPLRRHAIRFISNNSVQGCSNPSRAESGIAVSARHRRSKRNWPSTGRKQLRVPKGCTRFARRSKCPNAWSCAFDSMDVLASCSLASAQHSAATAVRMSQRAPNAKWCRGAGSRPQRNAGSVRYIGSLCENRTTTGSVLHLEGSGYLSSVLRFAVASACGARTRHCEQCAHDHNGNRTCYWKFPWSELLLRLALQLVCNYQVACLQGMATV